MEESLGKEDLMTSVAASQRHFDAAIADLDDAAMMEPGVVERWSIKDLVGHVAAWEDLVVQNLERWRRGEPPLEPAWSSADEYNAGEASRRASWTLAQVRDDAATTRQRLHALLAGITDEEWELRITMRGRERPLGVWIGGALSGPEGPGTHATEHAQHIRVWRRGLESGRASGRPAMGEQAGS